MTEKTYWNGEETPCVRGTGVVLPAPELPQFWGKHLVGERVPVVRVYYFADGPFYLYNQDGHGWAKVTDGKGSPRIGHSQLDVEKFIPDEVG